MLVGKLLLRVMGWNTQVEFPHEGISKAIIAVAPHTSNWDFIVGVAYRDYLRLNGTRFLGKAELFRSPFGFLFRWLGGIPVDRSKKTNLVDEVARTIRESTTFYLAVAPEGTRSKVTRLRSGFYQIARTSGIPIVLAGLDYREKSVRFSTPLYPSDETQDLKFIYRFFESVSGKNPENGITTPPEYQ